MRILDCVQRSDAWRRARCGHLTASRAHDILARGRFQQESASRRQYRRQLVVEQLTGIPEDRRFSTRAMRRGLEQEPAARAAYMARTGLRVDVSGFVLHDDVHAGCSLDGHVGAFEGVVEIKAPNTITHLRYVATRRVPLRYRSQMTHHLWVTGAAWCDFVSYDDRVPTWMQLFVVRFTREDLDVAGYDLAARAFLAEVRGATAALEGFGSPVEFFRRAPLDVARAVLGMSVAAVNERRAA